MTDQLAFQLDAIHGTVPDRFAAKILGACDGILRPLRYGDEVTLLCTAKVVNVTLARKSDPEGDEYTIVTTTLRADGDNGAVYLLTEDAIAQAGTTEQQLFDAVRARSMKDRDIMLDRYSIPGIASPLEGE